MMATAMEAVTVQSSNTTYAAATTTAATTRTRHPRAATLLSHSGTSVAGGPWSPEVSTSTADALVAAPARTPLSVDPLLTG